MTTDFDLAYPSQIGGSVTRSPGQRPSSGELDDQCLSKERDRECPAHKEAIS